MIEGFPLIQSISFFFLTLASCALYAWANTNSKKLIQVMSAWIIFISTLAYVGIFQDMKSLPPRFAIVLGPTTFLIIYGLFPKQLNHTIKNRNLTRSTFTHGVRIPVELALYSLSLHKMIPELMTFAGRNFDILAGITALIIGGLFYKNMISKNVLLIWNVIGILLLIFIVVNGILSSELPIQQFAFDQPNRALAYFPFVLLPGVIVPLLIYTHITDIIKIVRERNR